MEIGSTVDNYCSTPQSIKDKKNYRKGNLEAMMHHKNNIKKRKEYRINQN